MPLTLPFRSAGGVEAGRSSAKAGEDVATWPFPCARNRAGDRNKTVTLAGDGLHEARVLRIIVERLAYFADSGVDAVFGIKRKTSLPQIFSTISSRVTS